VPLSPKAIEILKALGPSADPEEKIFGISYEALKAGWRRACERAVCPWFAPSGDGARRCLFLYCAICGCISQGSRQRRGYSERPAAIDDVRLASRISCASKVDHQVGYLLGLADTADGLARDKCSTRGFIVALRQKPLL
jgi:hypothetical protein